MPAIRYRVSLTRKDGSADAYGMARAGDHRALWDHAIQDAEVIAAHSMRANQDGTWRIVHSVLKGA